MFVLLLIALVIAAAVHAARLEKRTPERVGEIALVWLLAGYCGVALLAVAVGSLVFPDRAAEILGFPAGNPFQDFVGVALVGMSAIAILALWLRGRYLVGPALVWIVWWTGATWVHVKAAGGLGAIHLHDLLHVFLAHGLVALLLVAALVASGVARRAR